MKRSRLAYVAIAMLAPACVCLFAAAAATPPATQGAAAPSARAVIEKVTQDALVVLRDKAMSKQERSDKVREIAYSTMDFETLSRLTLGSYSRDLTDTQRSTFVEEFRKHISATYSHTTDEYTNEDINVVSDQKEQRGDWTVMTRIMGDKDGKKQELAKVDYRLRQKEGQWKIIDVTIDGVSLMANFRAQFKDIMENGGFDKLIKLLREKNAAAAK